MSIIKNKVVRIFQKKSGRVLDGNNEGVYTGDWNGGIYQKWKIEDVEDGWCKIIHLHYNRVVYGISSDNFVRLTDWDNGDNQKWKFEEINGWYKIVHKTARRVISAYA